MDRTSPVEPLTWGKGQKPWHMQEWSRNVMRDQNLSKGALRIAWSLSYSFNSEDGRCWQTTPNLAKLTGMSESYAKAGLIELERFGHIVRSTDVIRENEFRNPKRMRIIRPVFNQAVKDQPARLRRGGQGSEPQTPYGDGVSDPWGTEAQTIKGTEGQTPCILDGSLNDPGATEPVEPGAVFKNDFSFGKKRCQCGMPAIMRNGFNGNLLCLECSEDEWELDRQAI